MCVILILHTPTHLLVFFIEVKDRCFILFVLV